MSAREVLAVLGGVLLVAAPAGGTTLFGLVDTGELFASGDQGASWSVRSLLPVSDAVELVAGDSSSELYLASRSGTIYFSGDAGVSWSASGSVTAPDVASLHIRPAGDLLVLARSGLVFRSTDAVTFTVISSLTASNMSSLSREAGPLYALAETGEISRSDDDAASWTTIGAVPAHDAVEIISNLDSDVFVITSTGDVWRSTDGGGSWNAVSTLSQVHTSGAVRTLSGTFYASTREGEIARSNDGLDWDWVGTTNQLNLVALATDETTTGLPAGMAVVPPLFVGPAVPNPLESTETRVALEVRSFEGGLLQLTILDLAGRLIQDETRPIGPGTTHITTDVSGLGTGVYFVRMELGAEGVARRVVITR